MHLHTYIFFRSMLNSIDYFPHFSTFFRISIFFFILLYNKNTLLYINVNKLIRTCRIDFFLRSARLGDAFPFRRRMF